MPTFPPRFANRTEDRGWDFKVTITGSVTLPNGVVAYTFKEQWLEPDAIWRAKLAGRLGTTLNLGVPIDRELLAIGQSAWCRTADGAGGLYWELVGIYSPPALAVSGSCSGSYSGSGYPCITTEVCPGDGFDVVTLFDEQCINGQLWITRGMSSIAFDPTTGRFRTCWYNLETNQEGCCACAGTSGSQTSGSTSGSGGGCVTTCSLCPNGAPTSWTINVESEQILGCPGLTAGTKTLTSTGGCTWSWTSGNETWTLTVTSPECTLVAYINGVPVATFTSAYALWNCLGANIFQPPRQTPGLCNFRGSLTAVPGDSSGCSGGGGGGINACGCTGLLSQYHVTFIGVLAAIGSVALNFDGVATWFGTVGPVCGLSTTSQISLSCQSGQWFLSAVCGISAFAPATCGPPLNISFSGTSMGCATLPPQCVGAWSAMVTP